MTSEPKRHPYYGLPISQAAYFAEQIGTEPISGAAVYNKIAELWPEFSHDQFRRLKNRLKNQVRLKENKSGLFFASETLAAFKNSVQAEKTRVFTLMRAGKSGVISLKTIQIDKKSIKNMQFNEKEL